ncbi:hypothetical protein VDIAB_100679 [Vibrio diabolicus]|nr:hypothetical protein VDIAB_100679 [Vibrio diabolicus]
MALYRKVERFFRVNELVYHGMKAKHSRWRQKATVYKRASKHLLSMLANGLTTSIHFGEILSANIV